MSAAKQKWAQVGASIMGRADVVPTALKGEKTFHWWVEEDPEGYRKSRELAWGPGQARWFDSIMKRVHARFGEREIATIRQPELQAFLNELAAAGFSESMLKNTRRYLISIFHAAKELGIINSNPAAMIVKPRGLPKPERRWLTVEQFQAALEAADSDATRLMLRCLYIGGLRRGELFGLQRGDLDGKVVNVERQITGNGKLQPAKTDGSVAPIAIPQDLADDLQAFVRWSPNQAPEAFVFQSRRGAHINPTWWRKAFLIPLGDKIGVTKMDYHMFRRGFATVAHSLGAGDKAIQAQLRHADANTSRNIYMQQMPSDQHDAVEKFARVVSMPRKRSA